MMQTDVLNVQLLWTASALEIEAANVHIRYFGTRLGAWQGRFHMLDLKWNELPDDIVGISGSVALICLIITIKHHQALYKRLRRPCLV